MAAQLLLVTLISYNAASNAGFSTSMALNKSRIVNAQADGSNCAINYAQLRRVSSVGIPIKTDDSYSTINTAITGANTYTAGKTVQVFVLKSDTGLVDVQRTIQVDDVIIAYEVGGEAVVQVEDGVSGQIVTYTIQGTLANFITATT